MNIWKAGVWMVGISVNVAVNFAKAGREGG